jgi:DNA-directed RNA polymerase sigma subunit (sigma70/sigma32)
MSRFGIDSDQGGKSFQVISKSLGISSTRTAQLYHRSIAQLRRALEEEESMVGEALAT